ncbi:response regulator transcription factor [Salinactinospora qingdaonensis]|uniref:Response regulator transcription factor n=1 Tax=Salinactinospora qingdaonensis TaxID=702744 RepID=A0ABP7GA90_9ACTN
MPSDLRDAAKDPRGPYWLAEAPGSTFDVPGQRRAEAAETAAPLPVLIVGSDPLARAGVRSILDSQGDMTSAGDCPPTAAAIGSAAALRPEVVLIHGMTAGGEAFTETVRAVRRVHCTARVLAIGPQEGAHRPNAEEGVCGLLPSSAAPEELVAAVRLIAAGYVLVGTVPGEGTDHDAESAVRRDGLSRRECEVLSLIARGLGNAEIAFALRLSEYTVKSHVQNLLRKLNLRNRVHAVIYAFQTGLGPHSLDSAPVLNQSADR